MWSYGSYALYNKGINLMVLGCYLNPNTYAFPLHASSSHAVNTDN